MFKKIDRFFGITEKGSTLRTEIMAGLTAFMTMVFVLMVNPGMLSAIDGMGFGGAYIATALSAFGATLAMGLIARLPFVLAVGMGQNAFLIHTVCVGMGFTYANAMLLVILNGLLFLLLATTGLRTVILNALPKSVMNAIPVGMGLFIAFVGMQDAGMVVTGGETGVGLLSFNLLGDASWESCMPILITLVTLFSIALLQKKNLKGGILLSLLLGTGLYYLLGLTVPHFYEGVLESVSLNPLDAFRQFGEQYALKVFTEGFDFSHYLSLPGHSGASLALALVSSALAYCFVDIFSVLGALFGLCKSGGMTEKNGAGEETVPRMEKAFLAQSVGGGISALCGTSASTLLVENSSAVMAGGRTGLTAITTALLFFLAMWLSPLAALIPAAAYSAVLMYIGVLMMGQVTEIQWKDPISALPSFLTVVMMPFTYNIAYGIAFGIISYVLLSLCQGKAKQVPVATWVLAAMFVAMFLLTH